MSATTELVFNLFYYFSSDLIIREIGCVTHTISGSDSDKLNFLHKSVKTDLVNAVRFDLPDGITIEIDGKRVKGISLQSLNFLASRGQDSIVFEKAFQHYGASKSPMILYTPVKDGEIFIGAYEDIR